MRMESKKAWYRWPLMAVAVTGLALFAAACSDDDDGDDGGDETPAATSAATSGATQPAGGGETITISAGESIKIGISTTLTTDAAELGIPIRDAALLALSERPDIEGFSIENVIADDLCSGPGSEAAAQQLIAAEVVAVIGPMCSGGAVAALDDYGAENIVVITTSATNTSVTAQGATNLARTAWNDDVQGEEMAKFVYNELNLTNVVLVDDQSTYGKGLMDVFETSFTELGGTVASREVVTVGEQDYSAVVTTITGESPEMVVFGGYIAEGAALVRQLGDAGYEGAFMGADGIADQDFIDQAGEAAEGAYVSRGPQALETNFDEFIAKYIAEYGEDAGTQFTDFTYDGVNVLLNAIEQVATVNSDGDLEINQDDLIAAVKGITLENGATGTVEFLDNGDRDLAVGAINRVDQVTGGVLVELN